MEITLLNTIQRGDDRDVLQTRKKDIDIYQYIFLNGVTQLYEVCSLWQNI